MGERKQRTSGQRCSILLLLVVLLVLSLVSPGGLPLTAAAEPGVYIGSTIHPEGIYFKPTPTRLDLTRSGWQTSADLPRQVRAARQGGMTMLRGGWPWDAIAPDPLAFPEIDPDDPDTWHWHRQAQYLDLLDDEGIEPLLLVHYGTTWLPDPTVPNPTSAQVDAFIRGFRLFAGETARRAGQRVRYYSLWNEPSLSLFWAWSDADFARLVVEASQAIKAADPNGDARIVVDVHALDHLIRPANGYGSQSTFMTNLLGRSVLRSDGQTVQVIDAVDIIAGHSYPDRTGDIPERVRGYEMATYYARLDDYLRWRFGATRGAKQFMHTETGWATSSGHRMVTETKQAALLARTTLNLLAARSLTGGQRLLRGIVQYDIEDDNPTGDYEGRLGLMRFPVNGDAVPKVSYGAMRLIADQLAGASLQAVRASGPAYAYGFASADGARRIWTLWAPDANRPLGGLSPATLDYTLDLSDTRATTLHLLHVDGRVEAMTSIGVHQFAFTGQHGRALTELPLLAIETLTGPLPPTTTPLPATPTVGPSPTRTPTVTRTRTPTRTATPAVSRTATQMPTATTVVTASPALTVTPSPSLTATATPPAGAATATPPLGSGPIIQLRAPVAGATLPRYGAFFVEVEATATDASGLGEVRIYGDDRLLKQCPGGPTCAVWWNPTPGAHTIRVTASNRASPVATSTLTIAIQR